MQSGPREIIEHIKKEALSHLDEAEFLRSQDDASTACATRD
jgi:hypothetical protein